MTDGFDMALDGLRVVECSAGDAGGFCGHALASMGASVVAIHHAADTRRRSDGRAIDVLKQTAELDLDTDQGMAALNEFCRDAMVFIEERPPAGWYRDGQLAARLLARNQDLLAVCITPFGLTGDHAEYVAYPLNCYHAGGHAQQIPRNDLWPEYKVRAPMQAGGEWGEAQCGLLAAVATLAAVLGGPDYRGRVIDCSKQEALISLNWTEVVRYPNDGKTISRLDPYVTFVGGVLPARDGYIQLVIMEEHQWQATLQLFGSPKWALSPALQSQADRCKASEQVAGLLAQETIRFEREDLFRRGQDLGLAISPVMTVSEVLMDGALRNRGAWRPHTDPVGKPFWTPRWDGSLIEPVGEWHR